jgi:hypothetical protein
MKLKDVIAGTVLAAGVGIGALVGAGMASAAPGTPGIDIAEKPHHDNGNDWDHPGRGWDGPGKWGKAGWNGIDACISATGPYGNVSGFVCI